MTGHLARAECFGKLFSESAAECMGGLDPAYLSDDGLHIRPPCPNNPSCKSALIRAEALKRNAAPAYAPRPAEQPRMSVPMSQAAPLAQPTMPRVAPHPATQGAPIIPQYNSAPPVLTTPQWGGPQQPQQVVAVNGVQYTQPQYASQPVFVPMNTTMPGAQVPSFLTVPEPYDPSVSYAQRCSRTVLRGVGKALAIGIANFLDHEPLGTDPRR